MPRKPKQVNPVVYRGGWWRAYNDSIGNRKLQSLNGEAFKFWFNCLCLASKNKGLIPSIDDVAYATRLTVEAATGLMGQLVAAKAVDEKLVDGAIIRTPHDWDKWQTKSEISTERVRKFRSKETDETGMKRFRNVSETDETLSTSTSSHVSREEGAIHEKNDDGSGDAPRPVQGHSLDGTLRNDPTEGTYGANVVPLTARRAS